MNTERIDKEMKAVFQKIGTETPPEDFTKLVMNKIEVNNPYTLSHTMPKSNYWSLIPYLIAMIIAIPFIVPTINWIINIDWSFILKDIGTILEWIGSFSDRFSGITISGNTIIISLACSVLIILLSIEIYVQNRRILN